MERRGFTLVEMLVVLAVGAILLAIASPGYAFLVNSSRLATVTNDFVTALQLARSEAIKRSTRVTVCKSSHPMAASPACHTAASWQQGWLVFVDGGVRGAIDAGDTLLWVHGPLAAGAITPDHNFSDFVSYQANGVSQGSGHLFNGKLHICLGGNQRDVIINNTGRVRLESTTC